MNTGWMMTARAAWIISALTVGIYVARQLGPYNFGILNYAIALTGIFSIIASMRVEEIVIRQLVRHPARRDRERDNFFMLRLLLFAPITTELAITLLFLHTMTEVKWMCGIIDDIEIVKKEVAAWQKFRNNKNAKVNWQFTVENARIKFAVFIRHLKVDETLV